MRCWPALLLLPALGCGSRADEERAVVVTIPAGLQSLYPHTQHEEYALSVLANVYDSLVEQESDLRLVPGLAQSWETPDDNTWVFRLREGVTLHDGRVLDAPLVAAALKRAQHDPDSRTAVDGHVVRTIDAADARTLVVKTARPVASPVFATSFLWIDCRGEPCGTGAYRVESWARGGDVSLVAFDRHWRGRPAVGRLRFQVLPEAADRVTALREGRAHLAMDPPAAALPELQAAPDLTTASRPGLRVIFLGLRVQARDGENEPLADLRVRRALSLAIDRSALVKGALGGEAEVANQLVSPEVFGYAQSLDPLAHDPRAARALLAEAGAAGTRLELHYAAQKYRAIAAVADGVARDLAAVGLTVEPRAWDPAEFGARHARGEFRLWLRGWMTVRHAGLSYDYLLRTRAGVMGGENVGGYSDPMVDDALERAEGLQNDRARLQLFSYAAYRAYDALPYIPLYRQNDLYAASRAIVFRPRLDRRVLGRELAWSDGN
ncbi:MAG: ABC transporter substrate-binding protein [Vicinamibacteria bacterium]